MPSPPSKAARSHLEIPGATAAFTATTHSETATGKLDSLSGRATRDTLMRIEALCDPYMGALLDAKGELARSAAASAQSHGTR
jgi:hypothetical protein